MAAKNIIKKHTKQAAQWLKKGNLVKARDAYYEAIKLDASDAKMWASFGDVSARINRHKDAEAAYQKALRLSPNETDYYLQLGHAQTAQRNYVAAGKSYQHFMMMEPESVEGFKALAKLAEKCGVLDKAASYYEHALAPTPKDPDLLFNYANLLQTAGEYKKALATYQAALELNPKSWEILQGLGKLYTNQRNIDQALETYQTAYQYHPKRTLEHYLNLVALYYDSGDWQQALEYCDNALQQAPENTHAHMMRAYILLALGRWSEGWEEHEIRLKHGEWINKHLPPLVSTPLWKGEALPDATILVEEDQGYGDSMHFCRYISLLAQRCKKVVVRARPAVEQIMKSVPGVDSVISVTETSPNVPIDRYVYMMSLPHYLGPGEDKILTTGPYLFADAEKVEQWKQHIDSDKFKIGIAWEGNLTHNKNAIRSIPLTLFEPLGELENVDLYSLQKRPPGTETENANLNIIDLSDELHDFSHTAAAITHLDLVISVDTAVAHLAGGLGKSVWTLLYYPPEWRWQAEGDTTPWYSSMRLFRQDTQRDWAAVIQQVVDELPTHIKHAK